MKKFAKKMSNLAMIAALLVFTACSSASSAAGTDESVISDDPGKTAAEPETSESDDSVRSAVDFDHELDSYEPHKDHYNFYFTYKTVHSWWDAVALGMEEAQRQYLEKGITVTYEYMAPDGASAADQIERLKMAEAAGYDVIGVDVADEDIISPILDEMAERGTKVMTFSSSDAAEGCKRTAYVGNTHNYQDGADLTEARCEKL
jgi:ribose transport system substrate-binding protein